MSSVHESFTSQEPLTPTTVKGASDRFQTRRDQESFPVHAVLATPPTVNKDEVNLVWTVCMFSRAHLSRLSLSRKFHSPHLIQRSWIGYTRRHPLARGNKDSQINRLSPSPFIPPKSYLSSRQRVTSLARIPCNQQNLQDAPARPGFETTRSGRIINTRIIPLHYSFQPRYNCDGLVVCNSRVPRKALLSTNQAKGSKRQTSEP